MTLRHGFALVLAFALAGCRAADDSKAPARTSASAPVPTANTAAPAHANIIERASYSLAYPSTWKLDEKDEDFDLDNYFAIDAPTSCHIQFFFFDSAVDEAEHVKSQRDIFLNKIFKSGATETPFTHWGKYDGHGLEMRGRMKPVGTGRVRAFAHRDKKRSFVTVEFGFDEDLKDAQRGFDQIASSFRLK